MMGGRGVRDVHSHQNFAWTGCFYGEFGDDGLDAGWICVLDCPVDGAFRYVWRHDLKGLELFCDQEEKEFNFQEMCKYG